MADISSITLPGGGTYDLKDKNSASAIASLNNRYTDNTVWIYNSNANDYKTSGMYSMATGNANLPASWGILFVIAPRHDTVEQEYRYLGNIWNREFRNNVWSAWAQVAKLSQLAYVETGTTASRNYTAGQFICWNGLTYTADTNIALGTTLSASGGNKNLTECMGGGFNQFAPSGQTFYTIPAGGGFSGPTAGNLWWISVGKVVFINVKVQKIGPSASFIPGFPPPPGVVLANYQDLTVQVLRSGELYLYQGTQNATYEFCLTYISK